MNASRTTSAAARTAGPLFIAFVTLLAALAPASAAPRGGGAGQFLALSAALRAAHTRAAVAAPRDPNATGEQRTPDGRLLLDRRMMHSNAIRKPRAGTGSSVVPIPGAVQTFDVFNPPPAFRPLVGFAGAMGLSNDPANPPAFIGALTATNLTPVWSADQTFLLFSSNRTQMGGVQTDGRFHIWGISVNGGEAFQITTSTAPAGSTSIGGEFFPTLSSSNNDLAFVSDAQSPNTRNLYVLAQNFSFGNYTRLMTPLKALNVSEQDPAKGGITSVTMRGVDAFGNPNTGFTQVGRPTFSPNPGQLAFSALSVTGNNQGHNHIYFLITSTGGFDQSNISFPEKFTDGPADDTDPAWSQDGQFIAFASTAGTFTNQPNGSNAQGPTPPGGEQDPNQSQVLSSAPDARGRRSIFFINGGIGSVSGNSAGQGQLPVSLQGVGGRITAAGTDDFGPAWSNTTIRNQYTNPAPGFEYIAFARGAAPTASHDIYYLQVVRDIDAGGQTGRSTEAGTTPEPIATPIYQIDAGNQFGSTPPYGPDNAFATGGTPENNPGPFNTATSDPGTPQGIYNTDRNGAAPFSYIFPSLTPGATYTVRLHFLDPSPTAAPGSRVFYVTANGQHEFGIDNTPGNATTPSGFDIAKATGTAPGQVVGLVSANGAPLAGATVTIAPNSGAAAVTTTTTAAATTNYTASVPAGTATETVSAPGFGTQVEQISVNSNGSTRADFTLVPDNATLSGTVNDQNGPVGIVPVTVTDQNTNAVVATTTSARNGTYSVAVPAGTYNVTAQPPTGRATTQTQMATFTAGQPAVVNFALQSGAGTGNLGGLITDTAGVPLTGVTVTIRGQGYTAIVTTTAVSSPAAPNGNGSPQNFQLTLPVGGYTIIPFLNGFAQVSGNNATVASGVFVQDATQVLTRNNGSSGGNTATVQTFTFTASRQGTTVANPTAGGPPITVAGGSLVLAFNPIKGNAIVEGIEVVANTTDATQSSGFGGFSNTSDRSGPGRLSALGGDGQVVLSFQAPTSNQGDPPAGYNIFRSPASPTSVNTPGANGGGAGNEGSAPFLSNVQPTTNPNTGALTFVDTAVTNGDEYFYQITAILQQRITPEGAQPGRPNAPNNTAIRLNTDDNAGQTSAAGNAYDDVYPTWSPFLSIFSIAYQSGNFQGNAVVGGRTVTYNQPTTSFPTETAVSVGAGGTVATSDTNAPAYTVGAGYSGIFESQVLNLDPPTLLRFSNGEIVHVQAGPPGSNPVTGTPNKLAATGGQPVTFTVRLSDREAGIDNTGGPNGGPRVYIQIKDPDSKYQDAQGLEHKVFSHDPQFVRQSNRAATGDTGRGSADSNLGLAFPFYEANATPFLKYAYPSYPNPPIPVTQYVTPRGAHGGQWPFPGSGNNPQNTYIFVGKDGGGVNPVAGFQGGDPNLFIPTGPEYEAQVLNPQFAASGNQNAPGDASALDYVSPYWLAGVDDQQAFSGGGTYLTGTDRPTTNVAGANGNTPAEWLQLQPVPAAQQDNLGGVLYTVTFQTPSSSSDFYLDVIAYDKAQFPNFPANTSQYSGGRANWRIYDNVGGFSTLRDIGSNDILFVSDYALGQKFAATTFAGQQANLNLVPKLFGTESYLTDVDVNILPDRVYGGIPNPTTTYNFVPVLSPFNYSQSPNTGPINNNSSFPTQNGLGVGSYTDSVISTGTRDGRTFDTSQKYSLWRILSRGPVPQSILNAYEPTKIQQPAINDPQSSIAALRGQGLPATTIMSAPRCIVWLSPYTGDLLTDPGTIDDPGSFNVPGQPNRASTQAILANYVQAGGRLFVTGQDVGSALTLNGTVGNAPSANPAQPNFLPDVLNAQLKTSGGGSNLLNATANRITGDPLYDGSAGDGHVSIQYLTAVGTFGNGIGNVGFQYPYQDHLELSDPDRNDAAFSQVPSIQVAGGASIQGQIDTITPTSGPGTTVAMTYTNGDAALVYHDDPYDAAKPHTLPNGGTGSRVVYAAFGLEAMSSDFYASDAPNPTQAPPFYDLIIPPTFPRNVRQAILHNIVCYLRTGSVSGVIRQTAGTGQGAGQGVQGVTVYLQPTGGAPPTRAAFSATTGGDGSYTIAGVEPGTYTLVAYKPGYARAVSNAGIQFTVEGDVNRQGGTLTINPVPPGSIDGTVTVAGSGGHNPIIGATVVFTSVDKSITTPAVQTVDGSQAGQPAGTFLVPSVPVTNYTGTATAPNNDQGLPEYQSASQTGVFATAPDPPFDTAFPVQSGSPPTGAVNFELAPILATVSGHVFDTAQGDTAAGQAALNGATVQAFDANKQPVGPSATARPDGSYTLVNLPATQTPTTYTITATKAGFQMPPGTAPVTVTVVLGDKFTGKDIGLMTIPPGSIFGTVKDTAGNPVNQAIVMFMAQGGSPITVTTGADGTFTIPNVPAGQYTGTAVGPKNPAGNSTTSTASQTVNVPQGPPTGPVNFVLTVSPPSISGTVTDSTTKALLAGVVVRTYNAAGTVVATSTTGADGLYNTGPLAPGGSYTVTFALIGYMNALQGPFTLNNGDVLVGKNVTLTPIPPGSISGSVFDNSTPALPVVGATVTFTPDGGGAARTATTDGNGNYAIPPPPGQDVLAGSYQGTVVGPTNSKGKPEYGSPAAQTVIVQAKQGATANFTLTALKPMIVGTVFDATAAASKNVGGAAVTLTPVIGTPVTVTANPSGVYGSGPLSPGTYTVTANAPGYFAGTGVPASVTVELGDTSIGVNVPLSQKATVFGLVTDATTGAALPGAALTVADAATGAAVTTVPAPLTTMNPAPGTDGQGQQNYLANLPPGTYIITASKPNYDTASSAPFTVGNAAPVRVDIKLLSSIGTLGGLVTDAAGTAPVGGATITVIAPATKTVVATVTTSGTASPAPDGGQLNYSTQLTKGTYTVTLRKGTQGPVTQTVTIKGGVFNRLDFTGATNGLPALHTFAAGFQFLSAPYDFSTSSFDAVFGALNTAPSGTTPNGNRSHVAVWDPTAAGGLGMYALDPNPPADAFRIGYGYWIFLKNSAGLTQPGVTPTTATVPVNLHPSWNQIGVASPNPAGTPVSSLLFDNGAGGTITFAQAVGSQYHLVSPTLYQYTAGAYQPITQSDVLLPYRAYWIKVYADATLEEPTR